MKLLFQISIAILIFAQTNANYLGGYNIVEEPEPCPGDNLVYFPANVEKTKLICDCQDESSNIYYPGDDSCYPPYRRGPCAPENYLVLPPGEIVSRCEENPCIEDGLVLYEGGCFPLNERGPPCANNKTFLFVEDYTYEIKCIEPGEPKPKGAYSHPKYGTIIDAPPKKCRRGTRRIFTGRCKREFD